jgi:hypothetical protein
MSFDTYISIRSYKWLYLHIYVVKFKKKKNLLRLRARVFKKEKSLAEEGSALDALHASSAKAESYKTS